MKKRIWRGLICLALCVLALTVTAFAADNEAELVRGGGTTEYDTFTNAYKDAVDGDTIRLLTDTTPWKNIAEDPNNLSAYIEKKLTIDLNGHELKCNTSLFIKSEVTFQGSGSINEEVECWSGCKVTIKGNIQFSDKLTAEDGSEVSIEGGTYGTFGIKTNATVKLSGGSFAYIGDDVDIAGLLQDGYAFIRTSNSTIVNPTGLKNIGNVRIERHEWHRYTKNWATGKITCDCGVVCEHTAGYSRWTGECNECYFPICPEDWPSAPNTLYVGDTLTIDKFTGGKATIIPGTFSVECTGGAACTETGMKRYTLKFTPTDTNKEAVTKTGSVYADQRKVMQVAQPAAVNDKYYGTALTALGLPETVKVTLSGGKTIDVPVNWNAESYQADSTATQNVEGTLDYAQWAREIEGSSRLNNQTVRVAVTLQLRTATAPTFQDKTAKYCAKPVTHEMKVSECVGVQSIQYSYAGKGETVYAASGNAPMYAGSYTVTATFTMEDGYTQLPAATATLTIEKIPATIKASDKNAYVGEKAPDLTSPVVDKDYTMEGVIAGDTVDVTLSCAAKMNTVGEYDIVPDAEHGGYVFTFVNGKLNVKAKPVVKKDPESGILDMLPGILDLIGADGFSDVVKGSYYEGAVEWAVENGITSGIGANRFAPDGSCTRAQAVTFLWRAMGCPKASSRTMPFEDVDVNSYAYEAVLWAVENGITEGTSATTFSPERKCSRGQIVTFLWRTFGAAQATAANPFADVKETAYYADAVVWAVAKGVTTGTSETAFSPDAVCTRGQIVTFIYRAVMW